MPIGILKAEDTVDYNRADLNFGEVDMSLDLKNQVLRDFEMLSDEQQRLAADYIRSLNSKTNSTQDQVTKNARIAKRLAVLKEMDNLAIEIGQHWKEDINAVELVASMRR